MRFRLDEAENRCSCIIGKSEASSFDLRAKGEVKADLRRALEAKAERRGIMEAETSTREEIVEEALDGGDYEEGGGGGADQGGGGGAG